MFVYIYKGDLLAGLGQRQKSQLILFCKLKGV